MKFESVQGVVEATSFEVLCLWEKYHKKFGWETDNTGKLICVGYCEDYPVNIDVRLATINNRIIMFWEDVSRVVDHDLIDIWIAHNCKNLIAKRTNAMNFLNAIM